MRKYIKLPMALLLAFALSLLSSASFVTAFSVEKESSTSTRLRFVVMADSRGSINGVNETVVIKTMKAIKKLKPQPSFAIIIGDMVNGSTSKATTEAQLKHFKTLIKKYYPESFFYPTVGNHEITCGKTGELAFAKTFGKFSGQFLSGYNRTVYSFTKGRNQFFLLNSDHPGEVSKINEVQRSWVKEKLLKNAEHSFFFFHEPAFPTGPHISESLDSFPDERDALWKVIESSSHPTVFCGHEHFYSRRHIEKSKSVYQVTTGSFGAPLVSLYGDKAGVDVAPISKYHFCVVDVKKNSVKYTVYSLDGKIIDQFYTK